MLSVDSQALYLESSKFIAFYRIWLMEVGSEDSATSFDCWTGHKVCFGDGLGEGLSEGVGYLWFKVE